MDEKECNILNKIYVSRRISIIQFITNTLRIYKQCSFVLCCFLYNFKLFSTSYSFLYVFFCV